MITRRGFLIATTVVATGALTEQALRAQEAQPMLKKAIKFGSVGAGKTIEEKFAAIKAAGFLGVEVDSPNSLNRDEVKAGAEKAGVKIHGVIDSVHWKDRLSDPDEAVRSRGLEALKTAIADAKFYGADTVLLVPGRVSDDTGESYQQVWDRSTAEVKKAIPIAQDAGVKIGIEVVWNNFITKPEQLVQYVDQFNTPTVGAYFDVSNMIKYGVPPAQWIRALGNRMLKFDFKGYSKEKAWVKIGEGDEDWPEVHKALKEIGYTGWATAEVGAKDEAELKDVADRMTKIGI
jgi:L-ribulose-5-phosphate 3-epimerase